MLSRWRVLIITVQQKLILSITILLRIINVLTGVEKPYPLFALKSNIELAVTHYSNRLMKISYWAPSVTYMGVLKHIS